MFLLTGQHVDIIWRIVGPVYPVFAVIAGVVLNFHPFISFMNHPLRIGDWDDGGFLM